MKSIVVASFLSIMALYFFFSDSCFGYEVKSQEEQTYTLKSGGFISLIGDEGFIDVKSWDKEEVYLKITKRAWGRSKREAEERLLQIDVDIDQSRDRLHIRQLRSLEERNMNFWDLFDPDQWGRYNYSVSVDFELKVPRNVNLRLETDEGDIDVEDINGDIDIEVDEGDIRLKRIAFADIDVSLDEGNLFCGDLKGTTGRLTITTDEGIIRIERGDIQKVKIECDEGDIILNDVSAKLCEISADEGNIDIQTEIFEHGKYYFYTDEGDVNIKIPNNSSVNVQLETEDGSVRTDFDLTIRERDDGERANGNIGNGDAKLEVYTEEGDIFLESKN